MSSLLYLIPAALFLGFLGLMAFLWALRSGQFDDLDGAAHRILFDDDEDLPAPDRNKDPQSPSSQDPSSQGSSSQGSSSQGSSSQGPAS